MRTVVLSDLHLGAHAKCSVAATPEARAAIHARVAGADRLVLLGDAIELRESRIADALGAAEDFFRDLGASLDGTPVTIVPGNHDHALAAPLIDAHRLDGAGGPLAVDASVPAPADGPLGRVAGWLAPSAVTLAYPGTWIRDDVYATHGHYLDVHNTVPTLECLAISLTRRAIGGLPDAARTPDDYEAALAPVYALTFNLAQALRTPRRNAGGDVSIRIWRRVGASNGRRDLRARALGDVAIPAAVGALNRAGLGPFRPDLSGEELRRAALRGIAASLEMLGVEPAHAIFGHTHRSGPWPGDDPAEWRLPGGGALVNSGSWVWERTFVGDQRDRSPYWPGTCVVVEDGGPPRLERLLDEVPAAAGATRT